MRVSHRSPVTSRFVDETTSSLVRGEILAQSQIRLQIPIRILGDLTALTTIERERGENDAADVVGDFARLVKNGPIIWVGLTGFSIVVADRSIGFTRDRDARVLSGDEDRSSNGFDGLAELVREACVLASPQRRLIWDRLDTQLLTDIRSTVEVLNECCLVVPPVEFFQHEQTKERGHLVAC